MAFYKDREQFISALDQLFERVQQAYPQAAEDLEKAKLILRFQCTDPEATILINGRRNPASVTFGDDRIRPEVDVQLAADTLHHILLGDLKLAKALASRSLKIRGPARKTLAVTGLFHQCQKLYPEVLKENGLLD
ncbi:MAG: SCP2 sterol-binding domain-containing protein [Chloroflexota bacterium]|nr:MAG: SCP2 sterol-binding domain-containing protein [Chloroflexota bacterium]